MCQRAGVCLSLTPGNRLLSVRNFWAELKSILYSTSVSIQYNTSAAQCSMSVPKYFSAEIQIYEMILPDLYYPQK